MSRIRVLEHNQSTSDFHYSRKVAKDLVAKGLAVWVDRWTIQRTPPGIQIKNGDSEKNLLLCVKQEKIKTLHYGVDGKPK